MLLCTYDCHVCTLLHISTPQETVALIIYAVSTSKHNFLKALHGCSGQLFCPSDEELAYRKQIPDKKVLHTYWTCTWTCLPGVGTSYISRNIAHLAVNRTNLLVILIKLLFYIIVINILSILWHLFDTSVSSTLCHCKILLCSCIGLKNVVPPIDGG